MHAAHSTLSKTHKRTTSTMAKQEGGCVLKGFCCGFTAIDLDDIALCCKYESEFL
jgi:hypothetical protein